MTCNQIIIHSLEELDTYLKTQETEKCNIAQYVWCEYGFYPIYFNDLFYEFFTTLTGKYIGVCFEGHELLYEDKVDDLIILKGFIDTRKTYQNNKETPLLITNFKQYSDKGQAFWYTLRNFDEDCYDQVINQYRFKNMIHSKGRNSAWKTGIFNVGPHKPKLYATGEKNLYMPITHWKKTGTLGWNLKRWKYYEFDLPNSIKFNKGEYFTIFVKNTWKTRNFRSKNINDFLVGNNGDSGVKGYGFVNISFLNRFIKYMMEKNHQLVIINDLVKYNIIPKNQNIIQIDMTGFFDIKKFCSIIHHSKIFFTSSTSPLDIASYYCNTNIVCLDDKQNKVNWVKKVLKTKGKKATSFQMDNDFNSLIPFIENMDKQKF